MSDWIATEYERRADPLFARITRDALCWRWRVTLEAPNRHGADEGTAQTLDAAMDAADAEMRRRMEQR